METRPFNFNSFAQGTTYSWIGQTVLDMDGDGYPDNVKVIQLIQIVY